MRRDYIELPFEGTAVRQPAYDPYRREPSKPRRTRDGRRAGEVRRLRENEEKQNQLSKKAIENRRRAMAMNRGYVLFLAAMAILTVAMCIYYLRLKETVTTQLEANAKLESQLMNLTNENDALLENITNSVDMERIKDVAMNKLGMTYATEDQIIWYNIEESGYVRQYRDVPDGD